MNRKSLVAGCVVVLIGVLSGAAFWLLDNISISYECQIDFLYADDIPVVNRMPYGNLPRDVSETYVENRQGLVLFEFNSERYPFTSSEIMRRCKAVPQLSDETEQRTRAVLSTRRIEVVEEGCTNSVYMYRMVLSDPEKRNLGEYARLCITMFKEKLEEDCELQARRAAISENQTMRKAERRIEEIENAAKSGKAIASAEEELRIARRTVSEMKQKIEKIRSQVMSTGRRRIIYEAPPEISWVIRRKSRNPSAAVGDMAHSPVSSEEMK